jgi:hypothetical protein
MVVEEEVQVVPVALGQQRLRLLVEEFRVPQVQPQLVVKGHQVIVHQTVLVNMVEEPEEVLVQQ